MPERPMSHLEQVCRFWETHPLCASAVPFSLGSPEYFAYYDALREANESIPFSRWLHEYDQFPGKRVLDIGCGNGYVLRQYARAGASVYGVDLTQTGTALSRTRFALDGLVGRFAVADVEQLPFPTAWFDCVCCMGVLHHTPDPRRGLQEIFRVLKPEGRVILMVYHRNSVLYRLRFPLVRLLTGKRLETSVNEVDGIGNPKGDVYSRKELRFLLRPFEEIETRVGLLQGWMIPKIGGRIPRRILDRIAGRWGWFLYAKARKPRRRDPHADQVQGSG
jgi:SAM-dependent methyltransferase